MSGDVSGCVFCRIIKGGAPATIVESGRGYVAFVPLRPHVRGHVLFVPRRHVARAVGSPRTAGRVTAAATRYLRAMGPQGNIIISSGPYATQTIEHLHVHVIPRGPSHDLPRDWPWMRTEAEGEADPSEGP